VNSYVAVIEGLTFFESSKDCEKSDSVLLQNDTAAGVQIYAVTGQTGRVHGEGQLRDSDCGVAVVQYAALLPLPSQ
jgi:hypothetical protein